MEVNKLYKGVHTGVVVKCTSNKEYDVFSGTVIETGSSEYEVGYNGDKWNCELFEEYTPTQVLTNGHSYNIPDGCKATIVDGVITIESNVKYYKESCVGCKMYFRVEGNKMVKIEIYPANSKAVFFMDGLINIDCKEECSESEFMKVYNSIKIGL